MPKAPLDCKLLLLAVAFGCIPCFAQSSAQTRAPEAEAQGANLPALPIGANDLIAVSVYDAPELTRSVRVSADGFIRLPMLKKLVQAQGLMPAQLESAIAKALQDELIIVDPFVTVTVAEYNSHPISVTGAVRQPLIFQATGPVTLLDAITRAGGLSQEAGPEILVTRSQAGPSGAASALVQRISAKKLLDAADPALNIVLNGGEEIRIPEGGKVYVVGNVKVPGAFPMGDGTETTVLQDDGSLPRAGALRREGRLYLPPRRQRQQERDPHPVERHHGPQVARHAAARQRYSVCPREQGQAQDCSRDRGHGGPWEPWQPAPSSTPFCVSPPVRSPDS